MYADLDKIDVNNNEDGDVSLLTDPLDGSFMNVTTEEEVHTSTGKFVPEENVHITGTVADAAASNRYECAICAKSFAAKCSLTRHLKSHDDRYQFHCSKCSNYFKTIESLNQHKVQHSKQHLCIECGQQFFRKSHLMEHMKSKHSEGDHNSLDLLKCPFEGCSKAFLRKTQFQDHLNVHSAMKPHSCKVCQKTFCGRYRRNTHEKYCNGQTIFECKDCNKQFADVITLRRHQDAKHNFIRHKCDKCGKTFSWESSLIRHVNKKHPKTVN